jgi:DNA-binding NarL/FixJ family response regulator
MLISAEGAGMTKILIVDDHPLYREGVIAALSGHPLHACVVGVSSAHDAIRMLDDDPTFELVLVDRNLPSEDGLTALGELGTRHPEVARVLISGDDSAGMIDAAVHAGAQGFLPKSLSIGEMLAAINRVLDGDVFWPRSSVRSGKLRTPDDVAPPTLTPRQKQVLDLLCEGRSNAQMAESLCISERTVKAHLAGVFEALGVDSRVRALVKARALGLIA